MSDFQRDAAIVAAIGSGFIFLGKLLDRLFGWRRQRETFAERLRNELREETAKLKAELDKVRAEANEWREKYLAEKELSGSLRNEYALLQEQHEELRRDFDALKDRLVAAGVAS